MSDNLVLEHLRAIRATQEKHGDVLAEVRERVGMLESQYASLSRRVDRIDLRLDRIERRLDIVEAPTA